MMPTDKVMLRHIPSYVIAPLSLFSFLFSRILSFLFSLLSPFALLFSLLSLLSGGEIREDFPISISIKKYHLWPDNNRSRGFSRESRFPPFQLSFVSEGRYFVVEIAFVAVPSLAVAWPLLLRLVVVVAMQLLV